MNPELQRLVCSIPSGGRPSRDVPGLALLSSRIRELDDDVDCWSFRDRKGLGVARGNVRAVRCWRQ